MDQQQLRQIAGKYIAKGEEIARNAAYAGEWTDGGGGVMVNEGKAFLAGLDGRLPENWRDFAQDFERERQREWAEYQRLKAKFDNA